MTGPESATTKPLWAVGAGIRAITVESVGELARLERIAADAGRLVPVVDRKTVDGTTVVILDGGVHHVLRPALVGQEHRVRAVSGRATAGAARLGPLTVAGPLCSGLDVFSQHAVMATPDVGDLMAVLDVGAYGFTESMPLFLSHPIPAEVVVRGGGARR